MNNVIQIGQIGQIGQVAVTGSTWRATTPANHFFAAADASFAPNGHTGHKGHAFTYANKYGECGSWRSIG